MEKLGACRTLKIIHNDSSELIREPDDTTANSTEDHQPHSSQEAELPNETSQHSINNEQSNVAWPDELETSFRVKIQLRAQIDSDELFSSSGDSSDDEETLSADNSKSIWKK